jgi:GntR family transcriptional regulator
MTSQTGALPIYQQIREMLIRDITAGRLLDGERLPPEREMAAQLGIAMGTLRRALAELTEKGFLERIQGSGNYVRAQSGADSVYAFFRLELVQGGGLPTAQVLSVDRLAKPADLPDFGTGPWAHRIRRLRFLSGQPAAVEEIWLDGSYAPRLTAAELSESLYLYYRTRLGLWIARAEDRVDVQPVPDWAPPLFPRPPGAPVGHVVRISWAQDGARAEVSRTWFDDHAVRYVARLR